jgi:hypothetical protein
MNRRLAAPDVCKFGMTRATNSGFKRRFEVLVTELQEQRRRQDIIWELCTHLTPRSPAMRNTEAKIHHGQHEND